MALSEEAIRLGFRIENGKVCKYVVDSEGNLLRKRKNWQNSIRAKSRQFLKDQCERCLSRENLTIHHKKPISEGGGPEKDNCQTLCFDCHNLVHNIIKSKEGNKNKQSLLVLEKGLWGEYRIVDRIEF